MKPSNTPGERPRLIAFVGAILIVIGYILIAVGLYVQYSIFAIGCLILAISLLYYCINIYEVGGKFKWVAILILYLPSLPPFLFFNLFSWGRGESVGIVISQIIIFLCFIWFLIYLLYNVKRIISKHIFNIPEKQKSPPDYIYVVISMMILFMFYSAIIAICVLTRPLIY